MVAVVVVVPDISHACRHNLISTSYIATFIAICEAMERFYSDKVSFTIWLLGTPAKECGSGKISLIDAGTYKDVDACLMVHLFPLLVGTPDILSTSMC